MFVSLAVVTVFMSAVLLISAGAKSLRTRHITQQMSTLGVPQSMMAFLIGAQVAGAAGVLAGLRWGPVGIAAAIGLTLYFAGAVASTCESATARARLRRRSSPWPPSP
ncbi:hypothetical protein GCM10010495_15210 [Kitasatospora herbaricolor]|uniref:DoxX family protein n=1 Tax=Kitasatospora herbaricolor TaxID=68217 RepID=UPI001988FE10|nr:DoxX family protein [Kitasatospora herbaricolor]MDQ0309324.1 putative oligopeptide transporter (OPT) family protein [Kitasatospora herbaricolor]GGV04422.1 hypothetical protein GCM10010495_15210 [Kitasatospora herbaricolor]